MLKIFQGLILAGFILLLNMQQHSTDKVKHIEAKLSSTQKELKETKDSLDSVNAELNCSKTELAKLKDVAQYYQLGVNECIARYKFIQRKPPRLIYIKE